METSKALVALAALAQDTRLGIYRLLVEHAPEGLPAGQIAEHLDISPATLSFHLKELTVSGLVTQEREGRNLIYRPSIEQMNDLLAYLTAHCCQGTAREVVSTLGCTTC